VIGVRKKSGLKNQLLPKLLLRKGGKPPYKNSISNEENPKLCFLRKGMDIV